MYVTSFYFGQFPSVNTSSHSVPERLLDCNVETKFLLSRSILLHSFLSRSDSLIGHVFGTPPLYDPNKFFLVLPVKPTTCDSPLTVLYSGTSFGLVRPEKSGTIPETQKRDSNFLSVPSRNLTLH